MPFDFKAYEQKCSTMSPEELQREWQHYTRLISGASTSTAVSGLAVPLTLGVSTIGVAMAAPAIHNARKKREIIERHLQKLGTTHNTRKRDVLTPMAFSGTLGVLTLGVGSMGAEQIGQAGAEHGISMIVENEMAVKIGTHLAGDAVAMGVEHAHTSHTKQNEAFHAQGQVGVVPMGYVQQNYGVQGHQQVPVYANNGMVPQQGFVGGEKQYDVMDLPPAYNSYGSSAVDTKIGGSNEKDPNYATYPNEKAQMYTLYTVPQAPQQQSYFPAATNSQPMQQQYAPTPAAQVFDMKTPMTPAPSYTPAPAYTTYDEKLALQQTNVVQYTEPHRPQLQHYQHYQPQQHQQHQQQPAQSPEIAPGQQPSEVTATSQMPAATPAPEPDLIAAQFSKLNMQSQNSQAQQPQQSSTSVSAQYTSQSQEQGLTQPVQQQPVHEQPIQEQPARQQQPEQVQQQPNQQQPIQQYTQQQPQQQYTQESVQQVQQQPTVQYVQQPAVQHVQQPAVQYQQPQHYPQQHYPPPPAQASPHPTYPSYPGQQIPNQAPQQQAYTPVSPIASPPPTQQAVPYFPPPPGAQNMQNPQQQHQEQQQQAVYAPIQPPQSYASPHQQQQAPAPAQHPYHTPVQTPSYPTPAPTPFHSPPPQQQTHMANGYATPAPTPYNEKAYFDQIPPPPPPQQQQQQQQQQYYVPGGAYPMTPPPSVPQTPMPYQGVQYVQG